MELPLYRKPINVIILMVINFDENILCASEFIYDSSSICYQYLSKLTHGILIDILRIKLKRFYYVAVRTCPPGISRTGSDAGKTCRAVRVNPNQHLTRSGYHRRWRDLKILTRTVLLTSTKPSSSSARIHRLPDPPEAYTGKHPTRHLTHPK